MSKIRTTNNKCRECVECLQEFEASNLSGRYEGSWYVVYSYGWYPLLAYHLARGNWFENADKYSRSTSRQLLQARPGEIEAVKLSHEGMKDLIQGR